MSIIVPNELIHVRSYVLPEILSLKQLQGFLLREALLLGSFNKSASAIEEAMGISI